LNARVRNFTTGRIVAVPRTGRGPLGSGRLNPKTGLSTDYLNHFTEAVMVLDLVAGAPEYLDDLLAWRAKSYRQHFLASPFGDRDLIIAAYDAATPALRDALDGTAETLNDVFIESRGVVVRHLDTSAAGVLSQRAMVWLRPLIARLAAVIDGGPAAPGRPVLRRAVLDAPVAR
jgi:hypothetical protein